MQCSDIINILLTFEGHSVIEIHMTVHANTDFGLTAVCSQSCLGRYIV